MKKLSTSSKFAFVLACGVSAGVLLLSEAAPADGSAAQELAFRSLVPQNRSVVERLRQQNSGWSRIRVSLLQSGANEAQANGLLRRVRRVVAKRPDYGPPPAKPLWPVWAKRATLGTRAVWVFEAATPGVLSGLCGNLTPEEKAIIEKRDKERCLQRVVVVQAKAPFKVLAIYDSTA